MRDELIALEGTTTGKRYRGKPEKSVNGRDQAVDREGLLTIKEDRTETREDTA